MFAAGPAEPPQPLEPARASGRGRAHGRWVGSAYALAANLTVGARFRHLRRRIDSLIRAVGASTGAGSDAGGVGSRVRFGVGSGMGTAG